MVSSIERPHSQTIAVPESNIGAHFGSLLENLEGSDVTFNVDGEKFQAHKLILAARSPIFRSEFLTMLGESKEEIIVKDLEPKVFKVQLICPSIFSFFCYGFWFLCNESLHHVYGFILKLL